MNRIFETSFLGDRKCYICSPTGVGAFDQEALGVAPLCLRCPGGGVVLVCWARFFSDGSFREGWPLSLLFASIQWPFRSPRLSFLVVSFFSEFLTLTLWGGRGGDKGWGGVAGPLSPPWSMPFPLINLLLFCTTSALGRSPYYDGRSPYYDGLAGQPLLFLAVAQYGKITGRKLSRICLWWSNRERWPYFFSDLY